MKVAVPSKERCNHQELRTTSSTLVGPTVMPALYQFCFTGPASQPLKLAVVAREGDPAAAPLLAAAQLVASGEVAAATGLSLPDLS